MFTHNDTPAERLEYLRSCIRAENISYGELAELQDLAEHIDPGDVELLQWANAPEDDAEPTATYIEGTITLSDGSTSRFWINLDGTDPGDYGQDGASTARLGLTVPIVEAMRDGILSEELI